MSNIAEFLLHRERMKKQRRGGARPNAGRPTLDDTESLRRVNVTLDKSAIKKGVQIGEGNLSLGIRRAIKNWTQTRPHVARFAMPNPSTIAELEAEAYRKGEQSVVWFKKHQVAMMESRLTFGSLFAGIGGFDLGLERAGMVCKWQVETDSYCNKILEKHWPYVKRYSDIRTVGNDLETVDLICGGFPCQPFSVAGKQKGDKDNRYLWPEMLRVIAQKRPAWIIGENVAGIIPMALDRVLFDLENQGYATRTFVIPACAVDAKHRRDRVWIIANSLRERRQQDAGSSHGNETTHEGRAAQHDNEFAGLGEDVADSAQQYVNGTGNAGARGGYEFADSGQWPIEPDVGRVANGVPRRVDRLRALGNAVVPQVVEMIGRAIVQESRLP